MANGTAVHTISLRLRKVVAAMPAVVFIGGSIALTAQAAPAQDVKSAVAAEASPVIVVPDIAMTFPGIPPLPGLISAGPIAPAKPALALPADVVPGSSTPVTLDRAGIPVRALAGYRSAAALIDPADPGCHIDWALLAAIGRIESDHARFGGNQLDAAGVARPGIIGIALDGSNGTARITDTERGLMDGDTIFDRAVGPMQFLPGTWRTMGADGDRDGVKNPQDMADAATAAAVYLCSGRGNLSQPGDLRAAIMRYNASDSYVRTVTAIAGAYRLGVAALPASALPVARPASPPARSGPARAGVAVSAAVAAAPSTPARSASTPASMLRPKPAASAGRPAQNLPTPTVAVPAPSTTNPAPTNPASTNPAQTTTAPPATLPAPPDPCPAIAPTTSATTGAPGTTVPVPITTCPSPAASTSTAAPTAAP
jgi:membrane-bound lytic murein transglycosylase B